MPLYEERFIVKVDGKEFDLTLFADGGDFEIQYAGTRYRIKADKLADRKYLFKINDSTSEVDINRNHDHLDLFLEGKDVNVTVESYNLAELRKRSGEALGKAVETAVLAPMPGLVLSLNVKPGDAVKKGDILLIIEAMKMENLIRASYDGKIREIFVGSGKAVEKNERLLEFE